MNGPDPIQIAPVTLHIQDEAQLGRLMRAVVRDEGHRRRWPTTSQSEQRAQALLAKETDALVISALEDNGDWMTRPQIAHIAGVRNLVYRSIDRLLKAGKVEHRMKYKVQNYRIVQ